MTLPKLRKGIAKAVTWRDRRIGRGLAFLIALVATVGLNAPLAVGDQGADTPEGDLTGIGPMQFSASAYLPGGGRPSYDLSTSCYAPPGSLLGPDNPSTSCQIRFQGTATKSAIGPAPEVTFRVDSSGTGTWVFKSVAGETHTTMFSYHFTSVGRCSSHSLAPRTYGSCGNLEGSGTDERGRAFNVSGPVYTEGLAALVSENPLLEGELAFVPADPSVLVGDAMQQAGCMQTSLTSPNPDPSHPADQWCDQVANGVQPAKDAKATAAADAECIQGQVGNPDETRGSTVCQVAGGAIKAPGKALPPRVGVPSDDCTSPSTTLIDGYFGTLYARLKTQASSEDTWICTRLQPEGGAEYAGGKLLVSDSDSVVGTDSNYGACSTQTDNILPTPHPFRDGHVGDPNDPPYVPYMLDAYANSSGSAWVCLQAGLGERVTVNGGASVFQQDDPSLAPSPPRTPWTTGKASTDCETQTGGTRTPLVNAVIGGTQVWLDAWQSSAKSELCVRVSGASIAGGRLGLDGPGAAPALSQGTDTTACTTDVFVDTQDQLYVRRSPTSANPASVCITKGTTSQRFTIGSTGTPVAPTPSWTQDT